jgi:dynamin-binding protein
MNGGADETIRVWWARFAEVDRDLQTLGIISAQNLREDPRLRARANRPLQLPAYRPPPPPPPPSSRTAVPAIIAALDPGHAPAPALAKSPSAGSAHKANRVLGESVYQDIAEHRGAIRKRSSREALMGRSPAPGGSSSGTPRSASGGFPFDAEMGLAPGGRGGAGKTRSMPIPPRKNSASSSASASRHHPHHHHHQQSSHPAHLDPAHWAPASAPSPRSPTVAAYEAGALGANSLSAFAPDRDSGADRGRARPSYDDAADAPPAPSPRKPSFRRKLSGAVADSFRPQPAPQQPPRAASASRSRRKKSDASQHQRADPGAGGGVNARFSTYYCQVVHPCEPPEGVQYRGTPFRVLRVGDVLEILEEHGHPSTHRDLPLYVDEGEDCLMLVRDQQDRVGWALASFLLPLD